MGKIWDTEKIEKFIDSFSRAYDRYTDDLHSLEDGMSKYYFNDTYRGQAAVASKNFIEDGQSKLHVKQIEIQRRLVIKYYEMLENFKNKVDSSSIARIDTDLLQDIKKSFKIYDNVIDAEGYDIESKARYIADKFGRINENLVPPSYRMVSEMYEDFCGSGGLFDQCIRKVEEFDEEMCSDIDQSGIEEDVDELQNKIVTTISGLDAIHVHVEDVLKRPIGLASLGMANLPVIYETIPSFFRSLNLFGKNKTGQNTPAIDTITVDDSKRSRIGTVNEKFITITGLVDDKGNPTTAYGGNQHWFDASTNPELGKLLYDSGCGVIASVNQYLYLTGQTTISKPAYMNLVYRFMQADDQPYARQDTHIEVRKQAIKGPIKGALPDQMATYVTTMCDKKGVKVTTSWDYVQNYEDDYQEMKKQLNNGIPVIWGQSDFGKENVKYYSYDPTTGEYTNNNNYGAYSHFVTVTAVYEETDSTGQLKRMVEISSCEKKYYVDYDQYMEVVGDNPLNKPFSSITHTTVK